MIPLGVLAQRQAATVGGPPLAFDSFNRGNGALGTADTGQAWTVNSGAIAIDTNTARASANGSFATLNLGSTLDVAVSATFSGSLGAAGVIARWASSASHYRFVVTATTAYLFQGLYNRGQVGISTPTPGDVLKITAETVGGSLELNGYINDILTLTYTGADIAGTRAGIALNTGTRIDDFTVEAI